MRVFIAIDIPQSLRKKIIAIQNSLPEFEGKTTEPENLHLTLKFLGEVDSNDVKNIKERLKEIKFKSFETEITDIGVFNPDNIRITWLHMKNCDSLQKKIDECLEDFFEPEKRFMSHLTIARVKQVKNKKTFLNELKKIKFDKIRFKVDNFKFKQSVLTETGSIYEDLAIYDLIK